MSVSLKLLAVSGGCTKVYPITDNYRPVNNIRYRIPQNLDLALHCFNVMKRPIKIKF